MARASAISILRPHRAISTDRARHRHIAGLPKSACTIALKIQRERSLGWNNAFIASSTDTFGCHPSNWQVDVTST